jgi:hypothetical protein
VAARELIPALLPVARRGLLVAGIDPDEADAGLTIVAERVARDRTGARWQRQMLAQLEAEGSRSAALREMLERYLSASASGRPVHEWPLQP